MHTHVLVPCSVVASTGRSQPQQPSALARPPPRPGPCPASAHARTHAPCDATAACSSAAPHATGGDRGSDLPAAAKRLYGRPRLHSRAHTQGTAWPGVVVALQGQGCRLPAAACPVTSCAPCAPRLHPAGSLMPSSRSAARPLSLDCDGDRHDLRAAFCSLAQPPLRPAWPLRAPSPPPQPRPTAPRPGRPSPPPPA